MRQRVEVIDPANQCERCPHALVRLGSGTMWCPCEDCHPGGRIQGREYKADADRITEPCPKCGYVPGRDGCVCAMPENYSIEHADDGTIIEDDPLWVDPIHSV